VLTASAVAGGTLVAVHVGDCRLLLLRDGRLSQLTKDHGEAPAPPAPPGAARNVTRTLGAELVTAVDMLRLALRPGDVLCQCPARVHDALGPELAELLGAHRPPAACRAVVRRAREEGVADVGAQVALVVRGAPGARRGRWLWR
jgi:serine/threonine protein phosphatase PrpC